MIPSSADMPEVTMASTYPPPVKAARGSHIVLAGLAIALTAINLRTAVTGFTPLLETIGADLGYGVKVSGLLGTVPAASFAVFGFFAPVLTRKFGLERSAAFALCLTTLALVVRAGSQNTIGLVLST